MTPEQIQRLKEMTLWLIQNPAIEESFCGECYAPQGEEILEILQKLKERGYDELLMLFIMRCQVTYEGQRALERFCAAQLFDSALRSGAEPLLHDFESLLSDEINRTKQRR